MNKKEIKLYIESVREYLINRYGSLKPEWECIIMLLKDYIIRYIQVRESINDNGIYDTNTGRKNPLLTTEKDIIASILKLSQKLGVSPWDLSKIKDDKEDDTEDYLNELTNGE